MEEVIAQIREGKVQNAINQLMVIIKNMPLEKDVLVLSSRNFTNERSKRLEIISNQDYNLVRNKITYELLIIIEDYKKKAEDQNRVKDTFIPKERTVVLCESNPLEQNLYSNIEIREIEEIIYKSSSKLKLITKLGLSLERFVDAINQFNPSVIHVTAFSNEQGIYFHDKADNPNLVSNDSFLRHYELVQNKAECIFFNTFIAEDFARNLSKDNAFVIGFKDVINSHGAIEFAIGFYNSLRYGKGYELSYEIGYQTLLNGGYKDESSKLYAYSENKKIELN